MASSVCHFTVNVNHCVDFLSIETIDVSLKDLHVNPNQIHSAEIMGNANHIRSSSRVTNHFCLTGEDGPFAFTQKINKIDSHLEDIQRFRSQYEQDNKSFNYGTTTDSSSTSYRLERQDRSLSRIQDLITTVRTYIDKFETDCVHGSRIPELHAAGQATNDQLNQLQSIRDAIQKKRNQVQLDIRFVSNERGNLQS